MVSWRLLSSHRKRPCGNRLFVFVAVLAVVLATSFLVGFPIKPFNFNVSQRFRKGKVGCINIVPNFGGAEGIGALVRRTQLAFFLASAFNVDINFPEFESSHGYSVHELFSKCPEAEPPCILSEEAAILARCPRGDCECLKRQVAPHVLPLARRCSVISVENGKDRTMEYAGCITSAVKRYLGMPHPPWERLDYDALHFRAGDLAGKIGGKAYHPNELRGLLKQMCLLSNRDIVIVTEGAPRMPVIRECGDRLVLAGNSSIKEAFGIFQHAKQVSLGISSFAGLMAEVVQPERMIIVERAAEMFEWMDCEKWTVVSAQSSAFHFDSKEMMSKSVISRSLQFRSFHTKQQQQEGMKFRLAVPRRRWSNDTSWILTPRE